MTTPTPEELIELAERLTPAEIEHAFDQLQPYHGKTNTWGAQAAILSSVRTLREKLARAPCDDMAVSDCIRCNAMFLVKVVERLVARASQENSRG